jgi:hypothetical protein
LALDRSPSRIDRLVVGLTGLFFHQYTPQALV